MKTYELKDTKNPDLFRVVDRDGDWKHYYHAPTKTYLRGVTTILDEGYAKGFRFNQWLLGKTKEEAAEILKVTGEKGDRIHRWIDWVLSDGSNFGETVEFKREVGVYNRESKDYEPLSHEEWDAILSFVSFWSRHEPVVYASELPVFNLKLGYAGTLDSIFKITKCCGIKSCPCKDLVGKIGLWDVKTGSGIRPSYSAQEAAYAHADNLPIKVEYLAILRLGTSHITTGGYEMEPYMDIEAAFLRFLAAAEIANHDYKKFDPLIDIKEIPDSVFLKVVREKIPKKKVMKKRKPRIKKPKQLPLI